MAITNATLAQQIADLVEARENIDQQFQEWLTGVVGGGVFNDGTYPLTDYFGITRYTLAPAALEDTVGGSAGDASASAAAALVSENNSATSESNASTDEGLADGHRIAAEAAKTLAETARDTSVNASVNATASQVAAGLSEVAALASEVAAGISESNASDSEIAAAASAAAAATFDPINFYLRTALDGGQLDNRYYTETEIDAGYASLTASNVFEPPTSGNNIFKVDSVAGVVVERRSTGAAGIKFQGSAATYGFIGATATTPFSVYNSSVEVLMYVNATGHVYCDGNIFPQNDGTNYVSPTRVANWQLAHGWGDHASGGYAAAHTHPYLSDSGLITYSGSQATLSSAAPFLIIEETGVTGTPAWWWGGDGGSFNLRLNNAGPYPFNINTNAGNDTITSMQLVAPSIGITGAVSVTGALTATNLNVSNWDTAYGWGDHILTMFKKFEQTISVADAHTVSAASELKDINGSSYNLTGKHELLVRGYIDASTGTDTAVIGRFYQDAGAWTAEEFSFTAGSNNPRLGLTSGGLPGIYHAHATTYNVQVEIEETNNRSKFGEAHHTKAGYAPLAAPNFTGGIDVTGAVVSDGITVGGAAGGHVNMLADTSTNDEELAPGTAYWEGRGGFSDWTAQPYLHDLTFFRSSADTIANYTMRLLTTGVQVREALTVGGIVSSAGIDSSANIDAPNLNCDAADGNGVRFWNSTAYRHYMAAQAYIGRMDSTSDYNQYFTMGSGTNRGFQFNTDSSFIFGINPDGIRVKQGVPLKLGAGDNADEDVLINFDIDRAWSFVADGVDASSQLALRSLNDKIFNIQDSAQANKFRFATGTGDLTATGIIAGSDFRAGAYGAAGTPTFSSGVDTDTGMYGEASNILAFSTAGVRRLQLYGTLANFAPPVQTPSVYLTSSSTELKQGSSAGRLRIQGANGYVDIGTADTSWGRVETDRANFYTNKPWNFNGICRKYLLGAMAWHASASYLSHAVTFGTGAASGGASGDIHYQYT